MSGLQPHREVWTCVDAGQIGIDRQQREGGLGGFAQKVTRIRDFLCKAGLGSSLGENPLAGGDAFVECDRHRAGTERLRS